MALIHMSDGFLEKAEKLVFDLKAGGYDVHDAARELEKFCAKANEEYAVDGPRLLGAAFGGVYDPGFGFKPHHPQPPSHPEPQEEPAAEPSN